MKIKFLIKKLFNKVFNTFTKAFPFSRYRTRYFNRFFLNKEKVSIIDIGSYGGYLDFWKEKDINYKLSFDPIEKRKSSKKNLIFNCALWNKDSEINIYFTKGGGSDSLEHNFDYLLSKTKSLASRVNPKLLNSFLENAKIIRQEVHQARSLDSILEDINIDFDFIKIDVQGAEKKILQGAEKYLDSGKCLGLLIETYTIRMFEEQSLYGEISILLRKYNYIPVLQYPSHGSFGCSNDTLFIKTGIRNAKLNTILKTYNLLRWSDGYYEQELND